MWVKDAICIALDVETTGLHPVKEKILEIGAVKFQGESIIGDFESLINPEIPIPPDVSHIHGITDDMVRDQPKIENVLPRLMAFIEDHFLVIHNAPFDLGFIHYEASKHCEGRLGNPVIDTCNLARSLLPRAPNYRLETLVSFLNISTSEFHRARADAMSAREVFLECARVLSLDLDVEIDKLIQVSSGGYSFVNMDISNAHWPEGFEAIKEAMELGRSIGITYRDARRSGRDIETIRSLGKMATRFTKRMVQKKKVRLEFDQANAHSNHQDRYGRILAYVFLEDGTFLNAEILLQGYSHAYTLFPFKYMEKFKACSREAKNAKRGLWVDLMETGKTAKIEQSFYSEAIYIANQRSKVFHYPWCRWAKKLKPSNTVTFISKREAILSGRRPCKVCKP